jgi:uncharacterized iron-regulated membrane protein
MYALLRQVHMYLGLLSWTFLLILGIAGLTNTFRYALGGSRGEPQVRMEAFTVPPNLTDKQVAEHVWRTLQLPLTAPQYMFGLQRDPDNGLSFTLYFENGISNVTVFEKENRLRLETRRNSLWEYFDNLHATAVNTPVQDWRIRLWTYYEEFATWALLAMTLSGVCLWLMSRPGHRVALVLFVSSCTLFLVLFMLSR